MNRDDLEHKLIEHFGDMMDATLVGDREPPTIAEFMAHVDAYIATERSIIEAQIADHVATHVAVERAVIARVRELSDKFDRDVTVVDGEQLKPVYSGPVVANRIRRALDELP